MVVGFQFERDIAFVTARRKDTTKNRLLPGDKPIHDWYRFVLAYPPHLVRQYLIALEADPNRDWIFDPFSGIATTSVEARLQGFSTLSMDANPISVLAAQVKLGWDIDLDRVEKQLHNVLEIARVCLDQIKLPDTTEAYIQLDLFGSPKPSRFIEDSLSHCDDFFPDGMLSEEMLKLIPKGFISERPLQRVLALLYAIDKINPAPDVRDFMRLALAHTIVSTAGNVGFGPEVYRTQPKEDADVLGAFETTITRMVFDLQTLLSTQTRPFPPAFVFEDDARTLSALDGQPPIGIVITSPPYPNEKDYTRSTRLESVLLGLIATKGALRNIKSGLLRSNTRNVYAKDDDDRYIQDIHSIVRLADVIEEKRVKLGKTSGFERLYHRVTRLYFGGMYRHLAVLRPRLRPGARCAYVVGDQMSYFRIHIPTARLLADVALKAGYQVEGIELWRTRPSTVTGENIEENVLILKVPDQDG